MVKGWRRILVTEGRHEMAEQWGSKYQIISFICERHKKKVACDRTRYFDQSGGINWQWGSDIL